MFVSTEVSAKGVFQNEPFPVSSRKRQVPQVVPSPRDGTEKCFWVSRLIILEICSPVCSQSNVPCSVKRLKKRQCGG